MTKYFIIEQGIYYKEGTMYDKEPIIIELGIPKIVYIGDTEEATQEALKLVKDKAVKEMNTYIGYDDIKLAIQKVEGETLWP